MARVRSRLRASMLPRAGVALLLACVVAGCGRPARIYVGTYTTGASRGIYRVDFDGEHGRFTSAPVLAAETSNPSFLVVGTDGRRVFAVNELQRFNGQPTGAVSAFNVNASTGDLSLINQQPSGGTDPCFIEIDPAARHVLVANYTSGTVAVLSITADGRLHAASTIRVGSGSGPIASRQQGPHSHQVVFASSGRFVIWTDLGSDRVVVDRYDSAAGTLTPSESSGVQVTPGSGPRHLAWHPSGRVVYLLSELSATVTQLKFDPATGALTVGQTIGARAAGATGENTAAEIAVSPDGRFLYTSNRGDDNLAVFTIDRPSADLKLVTHVPAGGRTPRHFAIEQSGRWLVVANQNSDSLTVFRIDPKTGIPGRTDATVTIASPVDVVFTPRK